MSQNIEQHLYSNVPFGISPELQKLTRAHYALKLGRTSQGEIYVKANLFNIAQFLRNHEDFKGSLKFDTFSNKIFTQLEGSWEEWEDYYATRIKHHCIDLWDVDFKVSDIHAAAEIVAKENPQDDLLQYIRELPEKWDGVKRIDTFLHDYFGVHDCELTRAYSRKHLIAGIARANATMKNLIKHDAMIILYGKQGLRKSSALEALCFAKKFGKKYFGDKPLDIRSKDAVQTIQGKFIYEFQELAKRSKDKELEKSWIVEKEDDIRLPYKRCNQRFARKCIFFGTTNNAQILTDATGSRRFWIVETGRCKHCAGQIDPKTGQERTHCIPWGEREKINVPQLREDAEQLWAEAAEYYRRYKAGESDEQNDFTWWLTDEQDELREQDAANFAQEHPLTQAVLEAAENLQIPTPARIIEELYKEKNPIHQTTKYLDKSTRLNQVIISDILVAAGYQYTRKMIDGKQRRGFFK